MNFVCILLLLYDIFDNSLMNKTVIDFLNVLSIQIPYFLDNKR